MEWYASLSWGGWGVNGAAAAAAVSCQVSRVAADSRPA